VLRSGFFFIDHSSIICGTPAVLRSQDLFSDLVTAPKFQRHLQDLAKTKISQRHCYLGPCRLRKKTMPRANNIFYLVVFGISLINAEKTVAIVANVQLFNRCAPLKGFLVSL
jgi:hypothetical protein